MHVVARRTGHVRFFETLASFQQRELIAVHVERLVGAGMLELNVIFERVADRERERSRLRHTDAAVTQAAQIHPALARQLRRVDDRLLCRLRVWSGVERDVLRAWSMTAFTRNAENEIGALVTVREVRVGLERRGVALETAR